jgi:hypothetical protein
LSFVLSAATWGIIYQTQQIKDKAAGTARADAAEKAQKDNTALFLQKFQTVSDSLSDLKTKVATEPLLARIGQLQGELQKTQTALAPGPKASLAFLLNNGSALRPPLDGVTLKSTADNIVTVPVMVSNPTKRQR